MHKTSDTATKYDIARTVIRQRNLCPICHLPLTYGMPVDRTSADTMWAKVRSHMKTDIKKPANYFGKIPTTPNMEICHLVGSTMIPEITKPSLYNTPAVMDTRFPPDAEFYMFPGDHRTLHKNKLFSWDINQLFYKKNQRRLVRAREYLCMSNVNYFLACADCNVAHTGHSQLQYMFKKMCGQGRGEVLNIYALYTILFDCMADDFNSQPPTINVTEERMITWQMELWINYCAIMFMAQQLKHQVNSNLTPAQTNDYRFRYAHRDIGMCDFYMNQILAMLLYVNYDIDVDFMWLHQNFLSRLPELLKSNGMFETADVNYNSTWRLVMARPMPGKIFERLGKRQDINADSNQYHINQNHVYFYEQTDIYAMARTIQNSIVEFWTNWLSPIGHIIDASRETLVPPTPLLGAIHTLFWTECGPAAKTRIEQVTMHPTNNEWALYHVMQNPTIVQVCTAFRDTAGPNEDYKKTVFKNFLTIAFRRTYAAFLLTGQTPAIQAMWRGYVIGVRNFLNSLP